MTKREKFSNKKPIIFNIYLFYLFYCLKIKLFIQKFSLFFLLFTLKNVWLILIGFQKKKNWRKFLKQKIWKKEKSRRSLIGDCVWESVFLTLRSVNSSIKLIDINKPFWKIKTIFDFFFQKIIQEIINYSKIIQIQYSVKFEIKLLKTNT